MNRTRRDLLIAAVLIGFSRPVRAEDPTAESAVYRALLAYFAAKAGADAEAAHLFIAEKPARLDEALPQGPGETPRPKALEALVPGTTESLRNRFLQVLESSEPIDARWLASEGRLKVTAVSQYEPEGVFTTWADFRARFPEAKGLLRLSRVAIDDDRQTALVYAGYWCGGTCGGGYLFLLASLNNGWRVVHEQQLWVAANDRSVDEA